MGINHYPWKSLQHTSSNIFGAETVIFREIYVSDVDVDALTASSTKSSVHKINGPLSLTGEFWVMWSIETSVSIYFFLNIQHIRDKYAVLW